MPRKSSRSRSRSCSPKRKKKCHNALAKWRAACRAHGYMKKGGKGKVPKKNTAAYKKIMSTFKKK